MVGWGYVLLVLSILRIVPETQAAERRRWNSKPSEEMRVTKGEGVVEGSVDDVVVAVFMMGEKV